MILLRYRRREQVAYGLLLEGVVHSLEGDPLTRPIPGRPVASLQEVEPLAPVVPSKVLAVGRNYAAHAAEFDHPVPQEPLLFLKPPSAVIGPGAAIVLPPLSKRVDHEAKLAVVIGRAVVVWGVGRP